MPKLSLAGDVEKKSGYLWKISIFSTLGIFWSLAVGFFVLKTFQGEKFFGLSAPWWLIIFLFILLINFILESIFSDSSRWPFVLLQSLAIGGGFYLAGDLAQVWTIALAIVPLIFTFWGKKSVFNAERDMLKIRWNRLTRRGVSMFLTGLIIFISLGFGAGVLQKSNSGLFISQEGLDKFLDSSNFIGRLMMEDFSWQMSFDDFSFKIAQQTTGSMIDNAISGLFSKFSSDIKGLANAQKQEAVAQSAGIIKEQAEKFLKVKIKGSESLSKIIYSWLSEKVLSLSKATKTGLAATALILIFLILKGFSPVVSWLVRVLTWFIYQLLLATGFAAIAYETRSKENAVLT